MTDADMIDTVPADQVASLPMLPGQPADVPWPTADWPTGELTDPALRAAVRELLEEAFAERSAIAETQAVVIAHHGHIVAERYAGALRFFDREPEPIGPGTPMLSWSIAKSVLHAAVGILVGDGLLDTDAPAGLPQWAEPDDPRGEITLRHLLRMRDGLNFAEDYVDAAQSDVIEMLFGRGAGDVAAFAADRGLAAAPGARFSYSSGTSNLVSAVVAGVVGTGSRYAGFLRERLFAPLGMASAQPGMDPAGTWVASSFLHATARDYARFGYLYLRDGVWEGRRILPSGWVDLARTPISVSEDGARYGEHWWMCEDADQSFRASGYEGQFIVVSPVHDLVAVRLGKTPEDRSDALVDWRERLLAAFAAAPSAG